jgi:ABC-type amino acid transport system permease subunit
MVQVYSTKRQRETDKGDRGFIYLLACIALFCFLMFFLTGCAGTLDKAVATCFALEGSPAFTKAEGIEKFECARPGTYTAARR